MEETFKKEIIVRLIVNHMTASKITHALMEGAGLRGAEPYYGTLDEVIFDLIGIDEEGEEIARFEQYYFDQVEKARNMPLTPRSEGLRKIAHETYTELHIRTKIGWKKIKR